MKAESREEYIQAARAVFAEKGYHRASEPMIKNRQQMLIGADFFFVALHDEALAKSIQDMHGRTITLLSSIIRTGIDRGELKSDLEIEQVTEILFASGRGIAWMYTILNRCDEIPKTLKTFVEMQFSAMTSPKTG